MNTFFRICVMFMLLILAFSLIANFIDGLGVFPYEEGAGVDVGDSNEALGTLTGLETANMQYVWLGVTGLTFIGAVALCFLTKSIVPLGVHLFGIVFWTSWVRMSSVLSYGGYLDPSFITIFTIGVMFVFIAGIIGLLTGVN